VGGMKKLVNFALILIFVLNNIFTPFSYAIENQWSIVLEEIPSIETSDGNSSETSDEEIPSESEMSDDTPSEDTDISDDLSSEDKETTSEDIDTTDEIIPADIPEENSTWTEVDIPTTWTDTQTWNNFTWWNIENNTWTGVDIPTTWTDVQTWNNFTWWNIENWTWTEIETWDNQIEISDFYDIVYTWIASWWLFTINLWIEIYELQWYECDQTQMKNLTDIIINGEIITHFHVIKKIISIQMKESMLHDTDQIIDLYEINL